MSNNWVYHWVQIMAHHKKKLGALWLLIICSSCLGLLASDFQQLSGLWISDTYQIPAILLLFLCSVIISLFFGWQSESLKSGILNLIFLNLCFAMTIGLTSWLEVDWNYLQVLALMIASTLVTANFVHLLSTLHREMARGLFQFDAVAEALKLNHAPIFLSNLTTALGVVFIAWFEPELRNMALVISVAVAVSYGLSISLFPWLLLNFFLEFRVGNTRDRQVFYQWVTILEATANHPSTQRLIKFVMTLSVLVFVGFVGYQGFLTGFTTPSDLAQNWFFLPAGSLNVLSAFMLFMLVLFWLWWRQLNWAIGMVFVMSLVAIIANFMIEIVVEFYFRPAGNVYESISNLNQLSLLMWIAPMGVVVDDLIHFFARMQRAKLSVFSSPKDSVRFAMLSVGRPILVTSITLIIALLLIIFVSQTINVLIALNVLISLALITIMVLVAIPLVMMTQYKTSEQTC